MITIGLIFMTFVKHGYKMSKGNRDFSELDIQFILTRVLMLLTLTWTGSEIAREVKPIPHSFMRNCFTFLLTLQGKRTGVIIHRALQHCKRSPEIKV